MTLVVARGTPSDRFVQHPPSSRDVEKNSTLDPGGPPQHPVGFYSMPDLAKNVSTHMGSAGIRVAGFSMITDDVATPSN